jgi:glycosyltransferase involved in cell wall biosynthesis
MKIIQITPGSGDNFYCENCLRDNLIVQTLRKLGHDAILVPLYLPPGLEDTGKDNPTPIFFGGINVYLQQKLGLFRKTPRWLDKLFDSKGLLRKVAKKVGMTSAKDLGETTISMLRGEEGRQVKELDRLVDWLAAEAQPDVVCLSNALLVGMARQIKERLGVPVVCLLQDEDGFLDGLGELYSLEAWRILRERLADVDTLIAVSEYYAEVMRKRLNLADERVQVVPGGVEVERYQPAETPPEAPTIGFLSRMCEEKGLDILAEAFIELKQQEEYRNLRLHIAGGQLSNDVDYIQKVKDRLAEAGVDSDVQFWESFEREDRIRFLQSLTVMSVPEREGEAFGLYILEAMAMGVPVVQPKNGVAIELVESTGGGVLYEPNDVETLAAAMKSLLGNSEKIRELGTQGRQAILETYNMEASAKKLVAIYDNLHA